MSENAIMFESVCGIRYSCCKSKKSKKSKMETTKIPRKGCDCPFMIIMKKWRQNPMEALFVTYSEHQKERAMPWLLLTGLLFNLYIALTPTSLSSYYCAATGAVVNVIFGLMYRFLPAMRPWLPLLVYLDLWMQFFINAFLRLGDSQNEFLGWAVLYLYLSITSVPLHIVLQILLDLGIVAMYIILQYYNALIIYGSTPFPQDFLIQQLANFCVLFGTMLLGLKGYVVWYKLQRSAFRETKKSLRNSLAIERESKEQERLLLSVLPEHVAVQMRKDLGLIDTQFKKIYMSRHENVRVLIYNSERNVKVNRYLYIVNSILYADIVGFTAISSTYSAQDLVAILNELFARFDRLAEKYNQLRIKILGDCYYCISGAPVERSDHAVLCVHMGLSMVKAIKYVQQTTNSPVDMRVGIHTGAVLAGVLGQRQWQFDVYSRDVELANKMESSGMAGRVHISEATLGFLSDEFEVEPAYGERRDEMLRHAGIKTYFIVKVLKPYQGHEAVKVGEAEKTNEGAEVETPNDLKDEDGESDIYILRKEGKKWVILATPDPKMVKLYHFKDPKMVIIPPKDEKMKEVMDAKILKMLKQELLSRDDDKELADATTYSLTFKDADIEKQYIRRPNPCPMMIALIPSVVVPSYAIIALFATPSSWPLHAIYIALVLEIGCFNITYLACIRRAAKDRKNNNSFGKVLCGLFNIGMFIVANALPLVFCGMYETAINDALRFDAQALQNMSRCEHPSYYYHISIIIACGVLWVPVGLMTRALLLVGLAILHIMPALIYSPLLSIRQDIDHDPFVITNLTKPYEEDLLVAMMAMYKYRNVIMLLLIITSLIIFNRYSESLERARFSRGLRMCAQAEQASDLRRRNQALVHNVLPPHVARYFLGARHHHRDLYSQSYAEVGVLFASMPNFSEFYSEETVNNQGLECLRFLNEVISDFDMLLEDKRFAKDIIKIKTIGSTYMAASGLNPTRDMQPSDGVQVRWAHLSCLVEFALELQRTLTAINEQSFNHFVLRLGVNHGPITAGVIGARKPHYDIWGNTVNVASRMESTGKAGCIQVTEETCEILQTFGYYFEQRGLVAVKGKGQLMTYYLQGKRTPPTTPTHYDEMEVIECQDHDALLTNRDASIVVRPASIPEEQLSDDAQSALI